MYLNQSWPATLATLTAAASWAFQQVTQMSKILFRFYALQCVGRDPKIRATWVKAGVSITLFWDQEVTRRRTAYVFGKFIPLTWWLVVSLCWLQYELSICHFSWFSWYWLPTFWNFIVASDHIAQNSSSFPQDKNLNFQRVDDHICYDKSWIQILSVWRWHTTKEPTDFVIYFILRGSNSEVKIPALGGNIYVFIFGH